MFDQFFYALYHTFMAIKKKLMKVWKASPHVCFDFSHVGRLNSNSGGKSMCNTMYKQKLLGMLDERETNFTFVETLHLLDSKQKLLGMLAQRG